MNVHISIDLGVFVLTMLFLMGYWNRSRRERDLAVRTRIGQPR